MGLITSIRENRMRVLPFALLLALGWVALGIPRVWNAMGGLRAFSGQFGAGSALATSGGFEGQYVGHAAASGYVGLAVLVTVLCFGVYLYAEMGETSPKPGRFPPR